MLTNDPNQRPLFTIFNTIGSMLGMGVMQFLIPIVKGMYDVKVDGKIVTDGFAVPEMWAVIAPIGIVLSVLLTILAIFGIAAKDRPEYYGIGGGTQKKVKISEYISIIKANKPMQRLMVAGAGCKLALAIATNATVLTVLYGVMMGDYSGLYLPFMVLGYVFAVPFFILSVRTSQKFGQKASLERYVRVALISYVGVLVLLILCGGPTALWARLVNPVPRPASTSAISSTPSRSSSSSAWDTARTTLRQTCRFRWSRTAPTTRRTAPASTSPASWGRCSRW